MYNWKDFKKITTYYNNVILGDKEQFDIRFSKGKDGILKSVLNYRNMTFSIEFYPTEEDECVDFKNITVSYIEFCKALGTIKKNKLIDLKVIDNQLALQPDKGSTVFIPCNKIMTRDFNGTKIASINIENFNTAFSLNDISSRAGIADFDKNLILTFENNYAYLNSYNDGIYVGNKIKCKTQSTFSCKLPYDYTSTIKKWLKYAIKPTNDILDDELELSVFQSFLMMKISHISTIIPINLIQADIIGEKFKELTEFQYPTKESISKKVIDAYYNNNLKEKSQKISAMNLFHVESTLYRPMFMSLIKQFSDSDSEFQTKIVDSKDLVLEFDACEDDMTSKILLFGMKPKN